METYIVYTIQVYSRKNGSQLEDYTAIKVLAENEKQAMVRATELIGSELGDREMRISEIAEFPYDQRFNG